MTEERRELWKARFDVMRIIGRLLCYMAFMVLAISGRYDEAMIFGIISLLAKD